MDGSKFSLFPSGRRIVVGILIPLVACGATGANEAPARGSALEIARGVPEIAAMLTDAARSPALETPSGFRLAKANALGADLPSAFDGTMQLDAGAVHVGLRRRFATSTPGVLRGGVVEYGAPGEAGALVMSAGGGVEELILAPDAKVDLGYDVEIPAGAALVSTSAGLEVHPSQARQSALRIRADRAWDATGAAIAVALVKDERGFSIHLDPGARYPVLVDPWIEFTNAAVPQRLRTEHTATLLPSGDVLFTGGVLAGSTGPDSSAEIYDGRSGAFTLLAATMNVARAEHTATLLPTGQVLLIGGADTPSAEMFDPSTGLFTLVGPMVSPRKAAGSLLLPTGKVLVAGGYTGLAPNKETQLASAEIYDPATKTFTATGSMDTPRQKTGVTLLASGKALVVGTPQGGNGSTYEIFDPAANGGVGAFSVGGSTPTLNASGQSTTRLRDDTVVMIGGCPCFSVGDGPISSKQGELFNPAANGGLGAFADVGTVSEGHTLGTQTLLPSGQVLVAGGADLPSMNVDIYLPNTKTFASETQLTSPRSEHTATLLASGDVLIVGGPEASADLFVARGTTGPGASTATPTTPMMDAPRLGAAASALSSGKAILTGGSSKTLGSLATTILFDPVAVTWSPGPPMVAARARHTITYLANGTLLVVGGVDASGTPLASAEIFDPSANAGVGAFTATSGMMTEARADHAATLLPNGEVLITGGTMTPTAELFDPKTGTFVATGDMTLPRAKHAAIALVTGKILILGGSVAAGDAAPVTAELYDPSVGKFAASAGNPGVAHAASAAAMLPDGRVLVAGGASLATEIYDPSTETFSFSGQLSAARVNDPRATTMPTGHVLISGGQVFTGIDSAGSNTADLFDPLGDGGRGAVTATTSMISLRFGHTAVLLPSGDVLLAGGTGCVSGCVTSPNNTPEVFRETVGSDAWRPVVTSAPMSVTAGADGVAIQGSGFIGLSASGDATSSSPSNLPIAIWQRWDGQGMVIGGLHDWTATTATWHVPVTAYAGPGFLRVAVDGIIGPAVPVVMAPAAQTTACDENAECASGFCVDSVCCDSACTGVCQACIASKRGGQGSDGTCGVVPFGASTTDACSVGQSGKCTTGADCANGICTDGVCCDMACGSVCEACDVEGSFGTCVAVTGKPHGTRTGCSEGAGDACAATKCDGTTRDSCATKVGPCAPYACEAYACGTSCAKDTDCATKYRCTGNTCVPAIASCSADGHTATNPEGAEVDCAPFKCDSNGACKSSCASIADCASPNVCSPDHVCIAEPPDPVADASCGCRFPGSSSDDRAGLALLAIAALVMRRRRSRISKGDPIRA